MVELSIKVPAQQQKNYTIYTGTGLLPCLLEKVSAYLPNAKPFVITDQNVLEAGHLNTLLGAHKLPYYVINPAGEISKHINTVISILENMEKSYLGRDSVIIALGGGTVGDIAGFAASVFKRGVPVIQVPTTTLAQADSAVGGKTGVDSSLSKNAFGAFWHPAAVYLDVSTLGTLNKRDYCSGLAESVKHAVIADKDYFDFIENNISAILNRDVQVMTDMASKNCRIKGHVVEIDPTEKNMRCILNYGHTIGHAVESASEYKLMHGEAVGIGMLGAGLIELEMGLSNQNQYNRIKLLLQNLGLPTGIPNDISTDLIMDLIKRDKKAIDKWPRFVLINQIGQIYKQDNAWSVDVDQDIVKNVIKTLVC